MDDSHTPDHAVSAVNNFSVVRTEFSVLIPRFFLSDFFLSCWFSSSSSFSQKVILFEIDLNMTLSSFSFYAYSFGQPLLNNPTDTCLNTTTSEMSCELFTTLVLSLSLSLSVCLSLSLSLSLPSSLSLFPSLPAPLSLCFSVGSKVYA